MKARELMRIIKLVQHAECKDMQRSSICGILIEARRDALIAHATDGKRYAIAKAGALPAMEGKSDIKLFITRGIMMHLRDLCKLLPAGEVTIKKHGIAINKETIDCFWDHEYPNVNYMLKQYSDLEWKTEVFGSEAFLSKLPKLSKKESREKPYCLSEEHDIYVNQRYLRELIKASKSENGVIAYTHSEGLVKVMMADVAGFIMPTRVRPQKSKE